MRVLIGCRSNHKQWALEITFIELLNNSRGVYTSNTCPTIVVDQRRNLRQGKAARHLHCYISYSESEYPCMLP